MNIQVLIENTTNSFLVSEHGLSLFITYNEKSYLLDAGATGAFIQNAQELKAPIFHADYCVLSHGHYDHAGGFLAYLEKNPQAKIYAMESAKEDYYSGAGGNIHEIGIPKEILANFQQQFCFVKEITMLDSHVYLLPHSTPKLEEIGKRTKLYHKAGEALVPDDFSHELSLVFDTPKGMVIFNSCSHGGIKNIMEEVKNAFPSKQIYAFVGGLHMRGLRNGQVYCTFSEEEIADIAKYLKEAGVQKLYTGHCTGQPALELLQKHLGDRVESLTTGQDIVL